MPHGLTPPSTSTEQAAHPTQSKDVCPKCLTQKREGERHQCQPNSNPQSRQASDSSLSTNSSVNEGRESRGDKEELQAFLHELYWPVADQEETNTQEERDDVVEAMPI